MLKEVSFGPILHCESFNTVKFSGVVRDYGHLLRNGMSGNQQIHGADGSTGFFQAGSQPFQTYNFYVTKRCKQRGIRPKLRNKKSRSPVNQGKGLKLGANDGIF